jgi:hypothetical protein
LLVVDGAALRGAAATALHSSRCEVWAAGGPSPPLKGEQGQGQGQGWEVEATARLSLSAALGALAFLAVLCVLWLVIGAGYAKRNDDE